MRYWFFSLSLQWHIINFCDFWSHVKSCLIGNYTTLSINDPWPFFKLNNLVIFIESAVSRTPQFPTILRRRWKNSKRHHHNLRIMKSRNNKNKLWRFLINVGELAYLYLRKSKIWHWIVCWYMGIYLFLPVLAYGCS